MESFFKLTDGIKKLITDDGTRALIKTGFISLDNRDAKYTQKAYDFVLDLLVEQNREALVAEARDIIAATEAARKESK